MTEVDADDGEASARDQRMSSPEGDSPISQNSRSLTLAPTPPITPLAAESSVPDGTHSPEKTSRASRSVCSRLIDRARASLGHLHRTETGK